MTNTARSLAQIEVAIQANRKALFRAVGGKFDTLSNASWQWAWDRQPGLLATEAALIAEYCDALYAREARKAAKAKLRHQRRVREAAARRRAVARAVAEYQMAA